MSGTEDGHSGLLGSRRLHGSGGWVFDLLAFSRRAIELTGTGAERSHALAAHGRVRTKLP